MENLKRQIEEKREEVNNLNKAMEHISQILPDEQIVEMYEIIHNKERILKLMEEKLASIKDKEEREPEVC